MSLVSLAVELHNAVETSSQISFRMIQRPTGKRVQYRKAVSDFGEVPAGEIVKGYEIDCDQCILLEPEEVEAVRLESKHVLDLVQFVDTPRSTRAISSAPSISCPPTRPQPKAMW